MRLSKSAKFYAAHRNQHLDGKCRNLHGHRYGIEAAWIVGEPATSGVTVLFEFVERLMDPVISEFDHALLLDRNDPDAANLIATQACGKVVLVEGATSVENLCVELFRRLDAASRSTPLAGCLDEITVRETDTSAISMTAAEFHRLGSRIGDSE